MIAFALLPVLLMSEPPRHHPPPATQNSLSSGEFAVHDLLFLRDRATGIDRLRSESGAQRASDGVQVADSGPIAAQLPFNELIPSWNLTVPPGTAYRIDLCVAAENGAWSDWFCVAAVGEPQSVPPTPSRAEPAGSQTAPGAKLHTDYLTCRTPCNRVRVRIAAAAGPAGLAAGAAGEARRAEGANGAFARRAFTIDRFALCLSNTLGDKRLWSRRQREKSKRADARSFVGRIDVPFLSQHVEGERLKGNICSPTSLAMVLNFRGAHVTPEHAAAAAFDRRSDLFGNWPFNVQAAYALGGAPGYVRRFADWDEVELTLARGQPIIASVRDPDGRIANAAYRRTVGHLLVICGFDSAGRVLVNDPAGRDAASGQLAYDRSAFEQCWLKRGGVAYVIEKPASRPPPHRQ